MNSVLTESFEIRKDPRVTATQADLDAQFALRKKIADELSETHAAINKIRSIRQQIDNWTSNTKDQQNFEAIEKAGKSLKEKLAAIEEELIQVKAKTRQDTLNFPAKLNAKLAALAGTVSSADAAPTKSQYQLFDDLVARIDVQLKSLQELIDSELRSYNNLIRELNVPAIIPKTDVVNKK